ncbi:WD repeat-containing protein 89 [Sinocyclocheilus rhinocerous]|uniref:WD repeat-containing protein 89 n=1 Tax=Sinocyclocheilus rhinocerous TaxID=307959 RepID=A0A673FLL9_9TELE|nr:PREDICTED: WD repeat-containing protein 89 [Sinocyclocheilus rhinocerous]XP_016391719.1 PREDICTED: WD repeat-containing protein 89 [Sinocyclocheilus rhinocerous]
MMDTLEDTFRTLSITRRLQPSEATYILELSCASSGSNVLAVCCSNHSVHLHSRETLRLVGDFHGHTAPVCGVRFSHLSPHLLFSGSADGTLRCWDVRRPGSDATQVFRSDLTHSYLSFDVSCSDRVLCAGTEQVGEDSFLVFWDARMVRDGGEMGGLLGVYSESHSDDITTVKFHPRQADRLASGATDGLVNVFDLSLGGEEDALVTTCNCNSSASSLCWTGKDLDQLLCLTHDEGLHLWDVARPDSDDTLTLLSSADARALVQLPDGASLEYFVGGTWLSDEERILLVGGSNHGELHLLDCSGHGLRFIKSLKGGHSATVRCFQWDAISQSLLTGGEDGQLLQWKAGAEEISVGKKDSLKSISSMQLKTKAHRKQAIQKDRSKLA